MALDNHARRFKLRVTEIEVNLLESQWREEIEGDFVEVEFAGKLLPSTRKRIKKALQDDDFDLLDRKLA